ncbi:MAG: MOP flippase family protein [Chloroflexota bacterium]|nr:MAG: MOP flippase family protein [Chloroflexota bacterium]
MNLRKKAAKGVVWSIIQKWGRAGISTISFIVLARILPPEAFGLVALATVFTAFVEIFLDNGFTAAIVQREDLEPEHLDTAFWTSVLMGVILTVVGILLSGFVASLFKEPDLEPILEWLSVSFVIIALSSTQVAILQRELAFKSLAARSLAATAVGGIVGVGMALAGFGVWSLVGQTLANAVAAAIVLWRASNWRPGFRYSGKHFKELFSFGISIIGNKILVFFNRRTDDFLIGYYLGPTMLGYYTIGYRLLLVLIRVATNIINTVAFPTFSRLQDQPEKMRRAFYKVTQYTSLIAMPVFLGMAVLAPELVFTFFGEKWAPSIPVMQILAFIGILQSILLFNGDVMKASGKPNWDFGIMLLTTACSVIGFSIAVQWGIVAVATSFVIAGYLVAPVSFFAVRKLIHIDFKTYFLQFVTPLTASLLMVATVILLKNLLKNVDLHIYVELSIYLIVGGLTYILIILIFAKQLSRQVLELIFDVIPDNRLRVLFTPLEKYFLK